MEHTAPVGALLREWRQRRRMSQLGLACEAEISSRHLSFIETGRSQPSRGMILQLADHLRIPPREKNALLAAGGFASVYPERSLDDPALAAGLQAVQLVLRGHEPYPALAVDRHWNLKAANRALAPLLEGIDPSLLQPPVNVLRLSLHPAGLAPRIGNAAEWKAHILHRLLEQIDATADEVLMALYKELSNYPLPPGAGRRTPAHEQYSGVAVPLRLETIHGPVSLISTTMVFGTPLDITLSELAIESFFPADEASAAILRTLTDPAG
ncbi:helix-turn-helix domain-containing protein [Paludibaculum fermentans]|uniref:helix-turn-helix domain-containing protein n=1 Tax=Paludibaculum fermentans TaxID=1473598 RepID=UPI003EBFD70D